ncbi:hypothetical protein BDY24DRAFT_367978 [Mrakia frigida]|uniref:uncharacterized protein n=1 Tax=Mrakia frigida TaxID=29902 RepID=UPI003FCBFE69
MPARPRPRAPPPQPLALPEFEPALPPLPSSPLENQATPSSASSSSSSFITIPPIQRPSLPSSASYDSRSADEEPTPWGGSASSSSSPPPLRGLANKFASMMGRAQPAFGEEGSRSSLSEDDIVKQAIEERDRSRREAEMVLAREEEERRGAGGGGGTIKASKASKKDRGPFFDATNSPSPRPSPNNNANLNPLDSQTPIRSKSSTSQLTPGPLHPSPYLIPRTPSSPTIDVEASLSLLANRFAKLEAWTVGHVRALEERVEKMEVRVQAVEEQGGEVGKLGKDLGELRGAMRAGFEAMEAMVTSPPRPSYTATTRMAPTVERVKEERSPSPALASTPPLVTKRSVLTPPVASTTPTTTPSSKPRTFAPVTTTAPLRTSHRSTVSISSIPHPASTQSFTSSSSTRTPRSTSPSTSILHTPTLAVPRSTSPLLSATSTPSSPSGQAAAPPPRKRYTTALGERASSSTSNLPLLNIPASSDTSENPNNGSGTPRSTPLPSSPFTKPTRSATGLLDGGAGTGANKGGRRRSRSVGGHGSVKEEKEEGIKASNLKRAQVGSLIGFWDKS